MSDNAIFIWILCSFFSDMLSASLHKDSHALDRIVATTSERYAAVTQATYTEIRKSDELYMSFSDTLRHKGDIYMARGDKYALEGRLSHAEGCWKKAEKKYNQANALDAWRRK